MDGWMDPKKKLFETQPRNRLFLRSFRRYIRYILMDVCRDRDGFDVIVIGDWNENQKQKRENLCFYFKLKPVQS